MRRECYAVCSHEAVSLLFFYNFDIEVLERKPDLAVVLIRDDAIPLDCEGQFVLFQIAGRAGWGGMMNPYIKYTLAPTETVALPAEVMPPALTRPVLV